MFRKVLLCAIAVFFSLQYIVGAGPIYIDNAPIIGKEIFIPESYGIIERSSFDKYLSTRFVILLKDAHCNYDAQHNIARILEVLVRDYKIDLVAIEGAVGLLDFTRFGKLENEFAKEKMADSLIKKGVLAGPEYLSIVKHGKLSFNVYGIEDENLYIENFVTLRQTINYLEETNLFINELNRIVKNLKDRIYTKKLLEFDNKSTKYYENVISLTDWVKELSNEAERHKITLKGYPNIILTLDAINLEDMINFKKVEIERSSALEDIEKVLSREDLKEMVSKSLQFRLGKIASKDYYQYLERLLGQTNVDFKDKFPNLIKYIELVKLQTWINNNALFGEISDLENTLKENMFQNNIQRQLNDISKKTRILNGLFKLTLTREDLEYYRSQMAEFSPSSLLSFINIQAPVHNVPISILLSDQGFLEKVSGVIENGEKFYNIALERDVKLVENTLKIMEKERRSSAIMVIGGFHTDGVVKVFEEKGVGYVIISPKILKAEKEGLYISLMMDKGIQIAQRESSLSLPHPLAGGEKNEVFIDEGLNARDWRVGLLKLAFDIYNMFLEKKVGVEKVEELPFIININTDGTVSVDRNPGFSDSEIPDMILEWFRVGLEEVLSKKENSDLRDFISESEIAKKYLVKSIVKEYRLRTAHSINEGLLRRATINFIQFYLDLCRLYETKGMIGIQEELGPRTEAFLPETIEDMESAKGYKLPGFKEELVKKLHEKGLSEEIARGIVNYIFTMNAYGVIDETGEFYETVFFNSYMQLIEDIFSAGQDTEFQRLLDRLRAYRFLQIYMAKVFEVDKPQMVKAEEIGDVVNAMGERKKDKRDVPKFVEILAQYLSGERFEGKEGDLKKFSAQKLKIEERAEDWWIKVVRGVRLLNEESIKDPLKRAVYVTTVTGISAKDELEAFNSYMASIKDFKKRLNDTLRENTPSLEKAVRGSKRTIVRDVSLYIRGVKEIEKGRTYTYQNVGAPGIGALMAEGLAPNVTQLFLYRTEEEKEAMKLYLSQNGITVSDRQFIQLNNYSNMPRTDVNVVILSAGTANSIQQLQKDRWIVGNIDKAGNEYNDLMLMDTLAYAVAEQEVIREEELKKIFEKILSEYYRDAEEKSDLEEILFYKDGILTIKLPPITPFVKEYYNAFQMARETISRAA